MTCMYGVRDRCKRIQIITTVQTASTKKTKVLYVSFERMMEVSVPKNQVYHSYNQRMDLFKTKKSLGKGFDQNSAVEKEAFVCD